MSITPKTKPQMTKPEVMVYLTNANISLEKTPVVVVGMRGYYANTFGVKNRNDRGFDDDAFFLITPRVFKSFNGNVDPSIKRSRIATLIAGIYKAVKWMHKGRYRGYQIVKDTVSRDGLKGLDTGRHGINFHKHQKNKTDSEGCQTLPESQYPEFVECVDRELDHYRQAEFIYLLIDKTK